jgi:hypothetical protein
MNTSPRQVAGQRRRVVLPLDSSPGWNHVDLVPFLDGSYQPVMPTLGHRTAPAAKAWDQPFKSRGAGFPALDHGLSAGNSIGGASAEPAGHETPEMASGGLQFTGLGWKLAGEPILESRP